MKTFKLILAGVAVAVLGLAAAEPVRSPRGAANSAPDGGTNAPSVTNAASHCAEAAPEAKAHTGHQGMHSMGAGTCHGKSGAAQGHSHGMGCCG